MAYKGKNALVTGGCGGLGKAIAKAFLHEGANVTVCDIRKELVQDYNTNVVATYDKTTLAVQCDVMNDTALDDLFEQAEKAFGPLDFVVNCAGMMDRFDPIGDVERALWDKVIGLNLTAAAMVTQRAVRTMSRNSVKGSIVNIASVASVRGFMSGVAYTTSKHGLIGLTKNTAAYYGTKAGIRCNAILPGGMQTNIFQNLGSDINKEGMEMMYKSSADEPNETADPSEHAPLVDVEDVAKLALYLCSDAAKVMNGSIITADGGTISH